MHLFTFATQICDQMIHDIIKKLQALDLQRFEAVLNRARDRNRTGTVSLQQDFKSCASASSATPAFLHQKLMQVEVTGLEPVTLCL